MARWEPVTALSQVVEDQRFVETNERMSEITLTSRLLY